MEEIQDFRNAKIKIEQQKKNEMQDSRAFDTTNLDQSLIDHARSSSN